MGFDSERVVDAKLREELTCAICFDIMWQPLRMACGHSFCARELNEWLVKEQSCPLCRQPGNQAGSRLAMDQQAAIELLRVTCANRDNGCTDTPYLRDLNGHEQSCQFYKFPCPFDACEHSAASGAEPRFLQRDLDTHTQECIWRTIKHGPCGVLMSYQALVSGHRERCVYVKEPCDLCGESVPRRHLQQHRMVACNRALVKCIHEDIGCSVALARDQMEAHVCPFDAPDVQRAMREKNETILQQEVALSVIRQELEESMAKVKALQAKFARRLQAKGTMEPQQKNLLVGAVAGAAAVAAVAYFLLRTPQQKPVEKPTALAMAEKSMQDHVVVQLVKKNHVSGSVVVGYNSAQVVLVVAPPHRDVGDLVRGLEEAMAGDGMSVRALDKRAALREAVKRKERDVAVAMLSDTELPPALIVTALLKAYRGDDITDCVIMSGEFPGDIRDARVLNSGLRQGGGAEVQLVIEVREEEEEEHHMAGVYRELDASVEVVSASLPLEEQIVAAKNLVLALLREKKE